MGVYYIAVFVRDFQLFAFFVGIALLLASLLLTRLAFRRGEAYYHGFPISIHYTTLQLTSIFGICIILATISTPESQLSLIAVYISSGIVPWVVFCLIFTPILTDTFLNEVPTRQVLYKLLLVLMIVGFSVLAIFNITGIKVSIDHPLTLPLFALAITGMFACLALDTLKDGLNPNLAKEEAEGVPAEEAPENELNAARLAVVNAIPDANIPEGLKKDVIFVAAAYAPLERKTKDVIEAIELWATTLPPYDLCVAGPGRAWGEYISDFAKTCEHPEYAYTDAFLPFVTAQNILGDMMQYLNGIQIAVRLKPEYRYEHTHIIGGSGHGKTQLLQDLILDDLVNEDISIVIIDSQENMLEKLLHVVPPERLVYLDPTHPEFSLALDTFRGGSSEDEVTTSVDLYEFMFASLENELTAKQQTVYRYVSRLLFEVPNANLLTMLDVLEHGTANYRKYMLNLNPVVINFFDNQFDVKRGQYGETRNQIAQRLYRLLENPTLQRMFTAPVGKIDLGKELQKPSVILINTASGSISIEGARLLGRYMIAQIASFSLSGNKTVPTMLYIDEAQEYLSAAPIVVRMFQQGRKRRLGITAAHQDLGAFADPALRSTLSANTTIKLAGGVSGEDVAAMARDMRVTKAEIDAMPKNSFLCSVRGVGTIVRKTDFLRLENSPQKSPQQITAIKQHMAQTYGYKAATNASASSQRPLNDPDGPQELD
ncbi:hypothetical protein SAMN04488077_1205 [Roseovarius tolerans]|uniref:AAA-like domain protein n=1 Tax=Roseovarius tolerans TaxID=74031 RepID=A0A1H8HCY0_9RHOB|nr:hypothetical protein [Roseovarius tolerans]SEN54093.1 hypothetical protein SAMN04488077_1205 [Roseovarius tolerans]